MWRVFSLSTFLSSVWGASSERYIWPWRAKKEQGRAQRWHMVGDWIPKLVMGSKRRWRGKRDSGLPWGCPSQLTGEEKKMGFRGTKQNIGSGMKICWARTFCTCAPVPALHLWAPNGQPHKQKRDRSLPNSPHVHSRNLHLNSTL